MITFTVAPAVFAAGVAIVAAGFAVLMCWIVAFEQWAIVASRILVGLWLALVVAFVWFVVLRSP